MNMFDCIHGMNPERTSSAFWREFIIHAMMYCCHLYLRTADRSYYDAFAILNRKCYENLSR